MKPEREAAIRECCKAGFTRHETAELLSLHYLTIHVTAHRLGLTFKRTYRVGDAKKQARDIRASKWRDLYLTGLTLEQIGAADGVTRERVRQVITKYYGPLARLGGQSVSARKNKAIRAAAFDATSRKRNGCSMDQYRELRRISKRMMAEGGTYFRTPLGAYSMQRRNARERGIPWNFNRWTWWQCWLESGKWDQRGRTVDAYVMARFGDTGSYSPDNVYITTASDNCTQIKPNLALKRAEQVAA